MQIRSYQAEERGDNGIVVKLHVDGQNASLLVTINNTIRERGEFENEQWVDFDLKILSHELIHSPKKAAQLLLKKRHEWERLTGFRD